MIELRLLGSADLRNQDGRGAFSVLAQPKRLALLAWLALARPAGFHRRDTIIALFWPELDADHARAALRKTIYHLRQALGSDVILNRGDEEVGLAAGLWCDAVAFQDAVGAGRAEEALALYRGDLLPGFFLTDVPDFEEWLERERIRLRGQANAAAWKLAAEAEASAGPEAVEWARRALALAPDDEGGMRRYLELLERGGDPSGAVRAFEEYRRQLAQTADLEPDPETVAVATAIRRRSEAARAQAATPPVRSTAVPDTSPRSGPVVPPAPQDVQEPGGGRSLPAPEPAPYRSVARRFLLGQAMPLRRVGFRMIASAAMVLAVAAVVWAWPTRSQEPVAIAIGHIRDFTAPASSVSGQALPDLLATNLSRAPLLHVVSPARIHELLARRDAGNGAAGLIAAARQSGADQVIEGALYQQPDGEFRLDLRRVSLRSAAVLASHTVVGPDVFSLVDRATAEILTAMGTAADAWHVADVTTRSLVGYRFYQEGMRFFYRGDLDAAAHLFEAALEEDSTFAMAAYFAAQSTSHNWVLSKQYLERAMTMSQHATARERLLIRARWADLHEDPTRLAIAESLAVAYPREPEAQLLHGRMLTWAGQFHAAIPTLRAPLALVSTVHTDNPASCSPCGMMNELVTAYVLADSLPAAEATAREWMRLVPGSLGALDALAKTLEYQDRLAEAMAVRRTASAAHPNAGALGVGLWPAVYAIRSADWGAADRFLRVRLDVGTRAERHEALWLLTISLRHQGRFRDALATARQLRPLENPPHTPGDPPPYNALAEALVLFEMGRHRDAAALWDSIANQIPASGGTPRDSRRRAWMLTHTATALHAAGDTSGLALLIPEIELHGRRSAYGRDVRLHHHVRGLLFAARGDDARAAAEFRNAIFSITGGYTRTNLELARALVRLGKPQDAVPLLRAAFRGPIGASNLYVTHTELRAALSIAFREAGQQDSATAYACRVSLALKNADDPAGRRVGLAPLRSQQGCP
jgi:DNA-binding SARP family transcriptional activator/tetratricopeptide (TPR) repeat protein